MYSCGDNRKKSGRFICFVEPTLFVLMSFSGSGTGLLALDVRVVSLFLECILMEPYILWMLKTFYF